MTSHALLSRLTAWTRVPTLPCPGPGVNQRGQEMEVTGAQTATAQENQDQASIWKSEGLNYVPILCGPGQATRPLGQPAQDHAARKGQSQV